MRTNTHLVIVALLLILILFCFSAQGQAQNTPPHNVSTDCGQTLNFDASNSNYVSVPYTSATNPTSTSISVWTNVAGFTGNFQAIACSRNAGPLAGWTLYIEPNANQYLLMAGIVGDQWNTVETTTPAQLNTWTHLVITMSGTDAKLFVNGTAYPLTLGATYASNPNAEMRIGAGVTDSSPQLFFNGQLDELTLWSRALSDTEVADLYAGNDIGSTGLEAYYDFNGGMSTTTLPDRTGHGHDGTLHNMDAIAPWLQVDGTSTPTTWYADLDNDGYASTVTACATSPGTGYGLTNPTSHTELDCDDTNPNVNPGHTEIPYNGIDDDCNPLTTAPFVTKWTTTSAGESITIPTSVNYGYGFSYSYYVDWGDGMVDNTVYTNDATHTYTDAGTYSVSIKGQFPHLDFGDWIDNTGNTPQIISVEQWGDFRWNSMYSSFGVLSNPLAINATDAPDLSAVTDMSYMFYASTLTGNLSQWNVSHVTDMTSVFESSSFTGDISQWDVSNVIHMQTMFRSSSFNNDISGWNVSHVTDMEYMFYSSSFNGDLSNWNIGNVTDMTGVFDGSLLSKINYEKALQGWATLGTNETQIPTGITLGADGLHYCDATFRSQLINDHSWSITADAQDCTLTLAATDHKRVDVNATVTFTVSPTYSGIGTLAFNLDNISLAESMSIDAATGAFTWTPVQSQLGKHYVTVTVTDGSTNDHETIVITVKLDQTITFDAFPAKTYGDATFNLTATVDSNLPITFTSSNPSVATISGNTVTIVGAGTSTIAAVQSGNAVYNSSTSEHPLTVSKAPLIAKADNKSKVYGEANPAFTISYTGFVNGDDVGDITAPTVSVTATTASDAGTYPITLNGGTATNYAITLQDGTLTLAKAPLTAKADNKSKVYGEVNPAFTISYTGFVNGDDAGDITVPTASVTSGNAGEQPITLSGTTANYDFTFQDGTLTVIKADQTITFTSVPDKTLGDGNFTLTATASSGLTVSYASGHAYTSITNNTATITSAGSETITANQSGSVNYNAAVAVSQTFCIYPAKPTIVEDFSKPESPVLTSSAATGNQWYKESVLILNATGTELTVLDKGNYTVIVSADNCTSVVSEKATIIITGIEANAAVALNVFPNPAEHQIEIVFADASDKQIEVISTDGKIVHRSLVSDLRTTLNIEQFTSGLYIVKATSANSYQSIKFIKK